MATKQSMALKDESAGVLALLLTLTPVYFLATRSKLGLDNLHIGLIQILLLFIARFILNFDPRKILLGTKGSLSKEAPSANVDVTKVKTHKKRQARRKAAVAPETTLFPPTQLDASVSRFLSVTEPSLVSALPPAPPAPFKIPSSAPLSAWTSMYDTPTLHVLQHPQTKSLYAICAKFDQVPLRKLFETLTEVEKRKEWDGMCEGAENVEEFTVGGRRGTVAWIAMKGVAVIKAKDMVLLSVAGRLPQSKEQEGLRIYCASTSFNHPKLPPKPQYNRMDLGISGFIAEDWVGEDGKVKGSMVTQITDLSGLGSWVPSAVVRTITTTMLPKSLVKLGKVANELDLSKSKYPMEGDEWLPPVLGSQDDSSAPAATTATGSQDGEEDDEYYGSDDEEDTDEEESSVLSSPAASRDLHVLVSQLRSITSRLSSLENHGSSDSSSTEGRWYSSLTSPLSSLKGGGVSSSSGDQLSMSHGGLSVITAAGGAVGAAAAVAILAAWSRRKP